MPKLLHSLVGIALLGLAASVLAVSLAAAGHELMPVWVMTILLVSGTTTLTGLFIIQLSVRQKLRGRDLKRVLVRGAPNWMRRLSMAFCLSGLALVVGLGFFDPGSLQDEVSILAAGALGLFFFSAGLVPLVSYSRRLGELNLKCSRGHELPFGAGFCPHCGERVRFGQAES